MKAAIVGIFCALVVVPYVHAQPRNHLSAGASYARITEDDGALGDGAALTVGIGRALSNHTYAEIEVMQQWIARDLGYYVAFSPAGNTDPMAYTFVPLTIRWRGTATFVMGSLGRTFSSSAVQPFVAGELGLMHYGGIESSVGNPGAIPPGLEAREPLSGRTPGLTALAFGGTTGARVRIGSRWFARPFAGLRLAAVGNSGPKYMLRYGIQSGVGW